MIKDTDTNRAIMQKFKAALELSPKVAELLQALDVSPDVAVMALMIIARGVTETVPGMPPAVSWLKMVDAVMDAAPAWKQSKEAP